MNLQHVTVKLPIPLIFSCFHFHNFHISPTVSFVRPSLPITNIISTSSTKTVSVAKSDVTKIFRSLHFERSHARKKECFTELRSTILDDRIVNKLRF